MPPSTPKNANERLVEQIDAVLPDLPEQDDFCTKRVLTYVRDEITPEGIERREGQAALTGGVDHLHAVAHEHLRRITRKEVRAA